MTPGAVHVEVQMSLDHSLWISTYQWDHWAHESSVCTDFHNGCIYLYKDSLFSLPLPTLIIFFKSLYITFDIICFIVTLRNQFSILYGKIYPLWLCLVL